MQRIEEIDILKGIAIFLMVMGHALSFVFKLSELDTYPSDALFVRNVIYSFHMPLFFFLSGYVINLKGKEYNFYNNYIIIQKRFISIALPALSYIIVYSVLNGKLMYEWFLPALFLNIVFFCLIKTFFHYLNVGGGKIEIVATLAIYVAVYVLIPDSFVSLKWDFKFFIYFYMGSLFFNIKFLDTLKAMKNRCLTELFYTISVIIYILSFYFGFMKGVRFQLGLLTSITGIFICFYLSQYQNYIPSKLRSFIIWMGKNTILIYILHFLIIPSWSSAGDYFVWLAKGNTIKLSIMIQLLYGILITLYTILLTGFVGWILSKSKIANLLLFGRKN